MKTAIVILRLQPAEKEALQAIKRKTGKTINDQARAALARWVKTQERKR